MRTEKRHVRTYLKQPEVIYSEHVELCRDRTWYRVQEKTTIYCIFEGKSYCQMEKCNLRNQIQLLNTYEIFSAQSLIKHNIFGVNPVILGIRARTLVICLLERCLYWRDVLLKSCLYQRDFLNWRDVCIGEMYVLQRCLYQRIFSIREISVLKRCLHQKDACITKMSV